MAPKRKTTTRSKAMPASPPTQSREQVEAVLNRLLCALALAVGPADGPIADEASAVAELVALVRGLASDSLERPIAAVAGAACAGSLAQALTAFAESWNVWTVYGEAPAAPVTPITIEVPAPVPASVAETPAPLDRTDEDVAALGGDAELAAMFIGEALDHLGTIEASILLLEAAPDDSKLLNDIFRPFHTVKGNAGALGVTRVQELAHKVENLLDLCRSGRHAFGPAETDASLAAVDVLSALVIDIQVRLSGQPGIDLEPKRLALMDVVQRLVDGAPAGPTLAPAPPSEAVSSDASAPAERGPKPGRRQSDDGGTQMSVKVDTRKLDNLVDMVGELVIAQAILQEDPALLRADERLTRNLAHLKRITTDLQKNAMSMRMVPIRQTFQKMARLVRDLSKRSGKSVELILAGEDTELDRRVVEDINDPLMHMVRNSVDHGIEDGVRRTEAGKRPGGRLSLSAYHQGGSIVIAIADDGAGLSTDRILAKAVSQGLVQPGDALSPADIHQLIFAPGFSTAETVTEISGRGVGMDVVRRNIDALHGRIEIQSTPGLGTTFLIKLPLTLAILDGLVLGVGSERYVMPTLAVRESLRPVPAQVHSVKGTPCLIQVRDKLVPLVRLSDLYGIEAHETDICHSIVVVIEDDGKQVGLVVDRLLGKQEVVIKSLGEAFGPMVGVAGGAILGDGRIGLILDAHGIVETTRGDGTRAA